MDEIKLTVRRLGKRPGAVIASVVTLACSIGATAATWSLLSASLLHPLPIADPDRLFVVAATSVGPRGTSVSTTFNYPMLPAVRDSGMFDAVTFGGTVTALVTANGEAQTRAIYFVTPEFFGTLGVAVQRGRDFIPADDQRGIPPVAILSDRLWRTAFGADPTVVGRTIEIERRPITIVGVAARGFP